MNVNAALQKVLSKGSFKNDDPFLIFAIYFLSQPRNARPSSNGM